MAPVYSFNPAAELPDRTSLVSSNENFQHEHSDGLPSIQPTPTTTVIIPPTVLLPHEVPGHLPVHTTRTGESHPGLRALSWRYINDIFGLLPERLADDNISSLLALAAHSGPRLSPTRGHMSPPGPVCIALGPQYGVVNIAISLPEVKVVAPTTLLEEWLDRPRASKTKPASLAGTLFSAANVTFAGRLFLNRVSATKRRAFRLTQSIHMDEVFRDKVLWRLEAPHKSTSDSPLDASTHGWLGGKPGTGAFYYALYEYIPVPPRAHFYESHRRDLEPTTHPPVVRVWGLQPQHLRV